MRSNLPDKSFRTGRVLSHPKVDDSDFDEIYFDPKKKVECICPKCGQRHKMAFHWIGRGTPRKYCPLCKAAN